VDEAKAIAQELRQVKGALEDAAEDQGLALASAKVREAEGLLELEGDPAVLQVLIDDTLTNVDTDQVDGKLELRIDGTRRSAVLERAVGQSIEVLRRRIDEIGVTEPVLAPHGEGRLMIQLPGTEMDPEQARRIITRATFLEFKLVLGTAQSEELLLAGLPEGLPEDQRVVIQLNPDGSEREALLVPAEPVLTGDMLEDARVQFDRRNRPIIGFTWNATGTSIFREFTAEHIGDRLAAILDGEVITSPVIRSRIGRNGQIEGDFTQEEAAQVAVSLRAGALPIPLIIEEERSIGPALGQDSIDKGLRSILIGGALVVLFMLVYYTEAGLYADVALVVNLVIIIGIMSLLGATLTLPGIAGLVLTVGMAVDANVIIFERIREELRRQQPLRNAVAIGFNRSRLTILDANVTTLIAALVLLQFGRGPVQGFGVTLAVGIVSSVFCALVVTRLLVDLSLQRNQKLRI
jgi:preprotein translocase subunit SecD